VCTDAPAYPRNTTIAHNRKAKTSSADPPRMLTSLLHDLRTRFRVQGIGFRV